MKPADRHAHPVTKTISTGIAGLDHILGGGLTANRLYLIEGDPGAGKTTAGLQFLLEGAKNRERVLYVTLSETAAELTEVAESHGWDLSGIDLMELEALAERLREDADYTVYHPSDVELGETLQRIRTEVDRLNPSRVVLDSVSELKVLSQSQPRYRREILALKQFFARKQCTVVVLDDLGTQDAAHQQSQSIAHGVIRMERRSREYGSPRRQLQIVKMRGLKFRDGYHDFTIETGGVRVYPRLSAAEHVKEHRKQEILSGIAELDQLLGGGLDRGSSSLVIGPAGCGKTTLCSQYVMAALERGESAACYLFEESVNTFLDRASGMNMHFLPYIKSGKLILQQSDPAELSPGEFAYAVKDAVEREQARVIVIDSINGYLNAMPSENFLLIHLRELLTYLSQQDVLTLLILSQHGMVGREPFGPIDVSFLADTVILLRFFEAFSQVRMAISIVKKRLGAHEHNLRELRLTSQGISIGAPLAEFEGVLTGVPKFLGSKPPLIAEE
ncbi:MAG TPA: ATPase domain-containing protein [Bryobacteraceae bacterium]|nr:ATPase domain-containing protein [Bryobacteraceae bacterium]